MQLPCRLVAPLFAVLCLVPAPARAADARAILAQVRLATGGAAWGRIQALRITARETTGPRIGRIDELEDLATGRYVTHEVFPDANEADGVDGVTIWAQGRSGVAYPLGDDDARLGAANDAYRIAHGWCFPERFPTTIEATGERRDGSTTFDTVHFTPEGGRPFTLWIDRATHLIARDVERTAEQIAITRYSDYRWVGGVLIPFTIDRDDGVRDTVDSVAVNPAFPEPAFSLPPARAAAIAAQPVTVPFRLEHDEIIVRAFINGRGPFDCLFDSGGSLIVPHSCVASALRTWVARVSTAAALRIRCEPLRLGQPRDRHPQAIQYHVRLRASRVVFRTQPLLRAPRHFQSHRSAAAL